MSRYQGTLLPSELEDKKIETETRKAVLDLLKKINEVYAELLPVSGSTPAGSYVKYFDGTMIQRGVTGSVGIGASALVTVPIPFADTSYQTFNTLVLASGANSFGVSNSGPQTASTFTVYSNGAIAAPHNWLAIGTWK